MKLLHLGAAALALAGGLACLVSPAEAANATGCRLGVDGAIKHIVFLQFDNVHYVRDNPNVPSDLEQMPNLLNFLTSQGALLTNHHTPLISHTSVDILSTLTGNYGDKMGVPIGNSFRYYNADGTTNGASSFAYWTDPLAAFTPSSEPIADTTPEMIDQRGKVHPAPWVPFTRAGCNVGAYSIANMEFENIGLDINTVFGPNSPQAQEAATNPNKAIADFEGIAIHCALNSAVCANGAPDALNDEPGGYYGYRALFGNANVQPQISPGGPITDLDGNVITDGHGNPGFVSGFSPTASQSLGYVAKMLENGVQVAYLYIADAHDNRTASGTFGPGEAQYVAQLAQYNTAFGKFFARLQADGITPANTLFIITADEGDHFVGSAPTPANCDGVSIPCTYAHVGEINADLSKVVSTEAHNQMPFTVHSDDAPTVYITGNPGVMAPNTRALELAFGGLTGVNPYTGATDNPLFPAIADRATQNILHMVSKDQRRTPTFVPFANPDYFLSASGNTTACNPISSCFTIGSGFAWNHGDYQQQIVTTFLGMVGPGVQNAGVTGAVWSDHTDVRPTMLLLANLKDDYAHDGRILHEVLSSNRLPSVIASQAPLFQSLVTNYKAIQAPVGQFGLGVIQLSTDAVLSSNGAYTAKEKQIKQLGNRRDMVAKEMQKMIEDAEFRNKPFDATSANTLIAEAQALLGSVP
jgi:hypothetical protein